MPTILLLDVSLSMSRPVAGVDSAEQYQRRHLAIHGINSLLDHCTAQSKLEFMSLIVYSSLWEQLVNFTRDYEAIKTALNKIGDYDKTCLEGALAGIGPMYINEWGVANPCQIVLITDCSPGVGVGSLKHSMATIHSRENTDDRFPLPYSFPCKLYVMCIANPTDAAFTDALPMYQKLVDLCGGGEVLIPDGPLSLKTVQSMFTRLGDSHFTPLYATLKCGNLKCSVQVSPKPDAYSQDYDFEHVEKEVSKTLEICGFVDIGDIASPGGISRHLILPTTHGQDDSIVKKEGEEEENEEGRTAAFTVLLHGSLKVEGMIAITQLAEDWYGIIYSWADSKKKSNLMLTVFEPGPEPLAWLGKMDNLAPMTDFAEPPYGEDGNKSPFPVRPAERRSYAQNCVVWIKATGLQADIQKILRHARKLPEKQQHFYKELNRLRKAALSFGFHELLDSVSAMLERECTLLPGTAHPDATLQLTHAASKLRSESAFDITQSILPLRTNFTGD